MDVLYVVGPNDGTDYFNLRMSLRSLEKFGKNLGNVIIAGYIPNWISSKAAKCLPLENRRKTPKQLNILNAILGSIDANVTSGEFLYSSDDHFLNRDVDLDNYPYYYKREEMPSFVDVVQEKGIMQWKGYYRSLTDTRTMLLRNGYDIMEFNGHVNTHMHSDDAPEVRRLLSTRVPGEGKDGYEPTCLFMNVRMARDGIIPTYREDCKIGKWNGENSFLKEAMAQETFSVGDDLDGNERYMKLMQEIYDSPSRFEN